MCELCGEACGSRQRGGVIGAGFALIKMLGSFAAFLGNFGIGELHEETGSFALPVFLIAGLMAFGALLTLLFKEPGPTLHLYDEWHQRGHTALLAEHGTTCRTQHYLQNMGCNSASLPWSPPLLLCSI